MASTFTPNLNLEIPARGDYVNSWDTPADSNYDIIDNFAGGEHSNRIINGDMRVDQRNNGTSGTAIGVYTVDRWKYASNVASKGTWQRQSTGVSAAGSAGFAYKLTFVSSSSYSSGSTDAFAFSQLIEADVITDFAWGTASAKSVTLSFWASAAGANGTFSGSIQNDIQTRSYPFTFTLTVSGTWYNIQITIPGDTTGTWVMSGNGAGVRLNFDLGSGSTFRGTASAWAAANYIGVTSAVSTVGTSGAAFAITGVKLEIGPVATSFNRKQLGEISADCQRYYQKIGGTVGADLIFQGYTVAGGNPISSTIGISAMRAAPTATRVGAWTLANVSSIALYGGTTTLGVQVILTAVGEGSAYNTNTTGFITLDAEL